MALVVKMANENSRWGYTRIRGAMKNLGHQFGRSTIRRILRDHGTEPVPERGARTPWSTFLKAHGEGLAAADFFTVVVVTASGLLRYFILFVVRLKTRAVEVAGLTKPRAGPVRCHNRMAGLLRFYHREAA